jgi:hypothetical protein
MSDCIHTPPGIKPCPYCEIERLRRELAEARADKDAWMHEFHATIAEQQAQLAEARGLLREARDAVEHTAKGALNLLHTETAQDLFELLTRMDKAIHADQPSVRAKCNCDDHDARYCVNRISRTVRCGCECHR